MSATGTTAGRRLLVARLGAAHGVRGEIRVNAFGDDPEALVGYGPLATEDGRSLRIRSLKVVGGRLIGRLEGVADRNAAEALNGVDLYVDRERLPPPEDEDTFYHADLVGLAAETTDGRALGTVVAVPDYGAGELLEIAPPRGPTLLVPFTRAAVPVVDIASGRVVVDPPAGLLDGGDEDDEAADDRDEDARDEDDGDEASPADRP
jgi:16S rRNA processing protein RimM